MLLARVIINFMVEAWCSQTRHFKRESVIVRAPNAAEIREQRQRNARSFEQWESAARRSVRRATDADCSSA
jgi:hypothetical protein